jgi:hypothetical protein
MKTEGAKYETTEGTEERPGKTRTPRVALFNKILCALLVKSDERRTKRASKKEATGGKAKRRIYSLNSRCSLCALWLKFDTTL